MNADSIQWHCSRVESRRVRIGASLLARRHY